METAFHLSNPSLSDFIRLEKTFESDEVIGIPVEGTLYYPLSFSPSLPLMFYVVGVGVPRIGKDSDTEIVRSMLDRGYPVFVLDYLGAKNAVPPFLDWSIQKIRNSVEKEASTYFPNLSYHVRADYVVPEGYNITVGIPYWSFDRHGNDGISDKIVEVWNNDFKSVKRDVEVHFSDGTVKKIGDMPITSIDQCVRQDGSPIDLDLHLDLIYPTRPDCRVPVMTLASSSQTRVDVWMMEKRPHLTGFLFSGYAGAIYDYCYTPMARDDHYGYFDGNLCKGSITGDNLTYSLGVYTRSRSDTAAIRRIRWLSDFEGDKYRIDPNRIGVYGNSKGGLCTRLGNLHPETLPEQRHLPGHHGETRLENGLLTDIGCMRGAVEQPWQTYSDGRKIPSNVQFVYSNCGGGTESIRYGNAPMYATGSMKDGSFFFFYPEVVNACRYYNVPLVDLVCSELGHAFGYGTDRDWGIDVYETLFHVASYWLKDEPISLLWSSPIAGTNNVTTDSVIVLKFIGSIADGEIDKIEISANGKRLSGAWTSRFGSTEWTFRPTELLPSGTEIKLVIPASVKGSNGKEIGEEKTVLFETANEQRTVCTPDCGKFKVPKESSKETCLVFQVNNEANGAMILSDGNGHDVRIPLTHGAGFYRVPVPSDLLGKELSLSPESPAGEETIRCEKLGEGLCKDIVPDSFCSWNLTTAPDGEKAFCCDSFKVCDREIGKVIYNPAPFLKIDHVVKDSPLTEADAGRCFRISFRIWDTRLSPKRPVKIAFSRVSADRNPDLIDWDSDIIYFDTVPGQWNELSFLYYVNKPLFWDPAFQKNSLILATTSSGDRTVLPGHDECLNPLTPIYLSDFKVVEVHSPISVDKRIWLCSPKSE